MASGIASEALPAPLARLVQELASGMPAEQLREIERHMLEGLTRDMQRQLHSILDVGGAHAATFRARVLLLRWCR